jgi:putative protease
MALLDLGLPPLPLHASTQAACDSPERVAFLANAGFERVILARELSLDEVRAIRQAVDIELEAFVFGALCVGESGRCTLSQAVCGRSGNRGECAQPCRTRWSLVDGDGRVLLQDKHLLSIHDLDLSGDLEGLVDAGVTSFKVEGRLKDADYVKNVVSYLRQRLDALQDRRPELGRASLGRVRHGFVPDPTKTFQRGLCSYRLDGTRRPIGTPDTAGHVGEYVGTVRSVHGDRAKLDRCFDLHPGDGLVFCVGSETAGTCVNAVDGPEVRVQDPSGMRPGTRLHRNQDHQWLKGLHAAKVERRIAVHAELDFPDGAVRLRLVDEAGLVAEARSEGDFEPARDVDATRKAVHEALARLGDTPFVLGEVAIEGSRFVPLSRLNTLRRDATASLLAARQAPRKATARRTNATPRAKLTTSRLDFTWNVANRAARAFYERAGAESIEPAAELQGDLRDRVVMTTRHCLRYELGWCPAHPNPEPWRRRPAPSGSLFLENGSTRLECRFDCTRCRMELVLR